MSLVYLAWVPRYCGNLGYERIDKLAKQGLQISLKEREKVQHDVMDVKASLTGSKEEKEIVVGRISEKGYFQTSP